MWKQGRLQSCTYIKRMVPPVQLHRTATHSVPVVVITTLLCIYAARHARSSTLLTLLAPEGLPLPRSKRAGLGSTPWRALVRLAGGRAHADAVAALLGVALGALIHAGLDIFYIVPVRLFWPHPLQFAFPLLLPPKHLLTSRQLKLAAAGDFISDALYFVPVLLFCRARRLHLERLPWLAAFWAAQILIVLGFALGPLMSESVPWQDFVLMLHAPAGFLFLCVLNISPLLLIDAMAALGGAPATAPATASAPAPAPAPAAADSAVPPPLEPAVLTARRRISAARAVNRLPDQPDLGLEASHDRHDGSQRPPPSPPQPSQSQISQSSADDALESDTDISTFEGRCLRGRCAAGLHSDGAAVGHLPAVKQPSARAALITSEGWSSGPFGPVSVLNWLQVSAQSSWNRNPQTVTRPS